MHFWISIPNNKEEAEKSVSKMQSNIERMKYMMRLGWYCLEFSEEEWAKFKELETELIKHRL
jgi:hypothetical protein